MSKKGLLAPAVMALLKVSVAPGLEEYYRVSFSGPAGLPVAHLIALLVGRSFAETILSGPKSCAKKHELNGPDDLTDGCVRGYHPWWSEVFRVKPMDPVLGMRLHS